MAKILKIEDNYNIKVNNNWYEGYTLTLDDNTRYDFLITNTSSCCESWGYGSMYDGDVEYFIGAEFIAVEVVDTDYKKVETVLLNGASLYDGDAMQVNVVTDRGILEIALYNIHNGYYGHRVIVMYNNVVLDEAWV